MISRKIFERNRILLYFPHYLLCQYIVCTLCLTNFMKLSSKIRQIRWFHEVFVKMMITRKIAETSVIYLLSLKEMYFRKCRWGKHGFCNLHPSGCKLQFFLPANYDIPQFITYEKVFEQWPSVCVVNVSFKR